MKNISKFYKIISLGLIAQAVCFSYCLAQCPTSKQFWNNIIVIENSNEDQNNKLSQLIILKKQFENCKLEKDSVYARMLHRMGVYQSFLNQPEEAINNTLESIRINTSGKRNACPSFAATSYSNMGFYYLYSKYNHSLLYFDSSILLSNRFPGNESNIVVARLYRGDLFYKKGNYEKDIQETTLGLPVAEKINDTRNVVCLLVERAQAFAQQQKFNEALSDVNRSFSLLENLKNDNNNWANSFSLKANILARQNRCKKAFELYRQCIFHRKKLQGAEALIAIDYNDAGELLKNNCNDANAARKYFDTAYMIGKQAGNARACALALYNLAEISFEKADPKKALMQNQQALQYLFQHFKLNNLVNPPYKEFLNISSKSLAEIILNDKSKYLLYYSRQTNDPQFLTLSIATAFLNDSIITALRHEQTGDQNKLYWRNDTRDFFINTIEACYLDNNPRYAFYFMEKSRAVLLNDKLNELGASADLPAKEELKKQELLDNITSTEQKLSLFSDTTKQYHDVQLHLYAVKENFERYIKNLEDSYPAYYQYKYADEVPSLEELQQYLSKNSQSFVHYFLGDTVIYALAVTASSTQFIRLPQKEFNLEKLSHYLQMCANKEALNNQYDSFAGLSHSIYAALFQPLHLPKGRVVVCADNIIIPFEALSSDKQGKSFLLTDYSFSYVYSARFLMKEFNNPVARGNFLGFAPVSFAKYLGVNDLKNAADALHASSAYYKNDKLFTYQNATRHNFFACAPSYAVINIFSHAKGDTTGNEPELFMQDSVIHLSELQLLNTPATKLVLLSACQTNVGKVATGEGIYSLARGFATAGIPAVAATLWKADEQTIYTISEMFNKYLSEGMRKDEALQKAKLYFIQHNSSDKMLPYFWANMIAIGNMDAINLTTTKNYWWWIVGLMAGVSTVIIFFILKKLKQQKS